MSDFERFGMVGETPVDGVDIDVMQEEALKMGASPEFLAECLQKYGPDVLSTVTEGLRNGFSISFIFESFRLFGPFVMDFFVVKKEDGCKSCCSRSSWVCRFG